MVLTRSHIKLLRECLLSGPCSVGLLLLLPACGSGTDTTQTVTPQANTAQENTTQAETGPEESNQEETNQEDITESSSTPSVSNPLTDNAQVLQPTHSYLCLAINGNSLVQTQCTDNNQKFEFRDAGNNVMRWHLPSTNRCLHINNNSSQLGEALVAGTCESNDTEYWRVSEVRGGLQLTNDYSGLCAGISDRSSSPNTELNQWPCNGQENQVFLFGTNESPIPEVVTDLNVSNDPDRPTTQVQVQAQDETLSLPSMIQRPRKLFHATYKTPLTICSVRVSPTYQTEEYS